MEPKRVCLFMRCCRLRKLCLRPAANMRILPEEVTRKRLLTEDLVLSPFAIVGSPSFLVFLLFCFGVFRFLERSKKGTQKRWLHSIDYSRERKTPYALIMPLPEEF